MIRMSAPANTASNVAVNLLSSSRTRNRKRWFDGQDPWTDVGLLRNPGPGRVGGDSHDVHAATAVLDHHEDVEAAQEDRVDVAKSIARIASACAEKNCRQVGPDRRGAGSSPALFKIFQTVEAAAASPRPTSSPWMRLGPQRDFSGRPQHQDADRLWGGWSA